MMKLFPITIAAALLAAGCAHNDVDSLPLANSNLHNLKASPVVTQPESTRSFWNWFDDGLTHTTIRTYRDRKWINSRDRMKIDRVEYERQITGGCGEAGCTTKTRINRR